MTRTYIIILANAVHPRGQNKAMVSLRNRTATAVTAALKLSASEEERMRLARITGYNDSFAASRRINVRNGQVKTGIDVLEVHNFDRLRARRTREGAAHRAADQSDRHGRAGPAHH